MTVTMMRRVKMRIRTVGMIDLMSCNGRQETDEVNTELMSYLETDSSILQDCSPTSCTERSAVPRKYGLKSARLWWSDGGGEWHSPDPPRHCKLPVWCSSWFLTIPDPSGVLTLKWYNFPIGSLYSLSLKIMATLNFLYWAAISYWGAAVLDQVARQKLQTLTKLRELLIQLKSGFHIEQQQQIIWIETKWFVSNEKWYKKI